MRLGVGLAAVSKLQYSLTFLLFVSFTVSALFASGKKRLTFHMLLHPRLHFVRRLLVIIVVNTENAA